MTKKERFIEKLGALSTEEKKEVTEFFTKYPNYENLIDWNNTSLAYRDFEKVLSLAENSSRSIKRKTKIDPRLLFAKYNCEIIRETGDFLIVVPLDWECAVFFNSFECGGEGAQWCIGESDDAYNWNTYLANKNVFFLVFFMNTHPVYKRKSIIQYGVKDGEYTLWLQDNTVLDMLSSPFDTLRKLVKNSAERLLSRICPRDYVLNGSTLIKWYNPETVDIPVNVTTIGDDAFSECESPTTIDIPCSVTAIGDNVFSSCENLSSIRVEKQNQRFTDIDGVLIDKIEKRILCYPQGKKGKRYTIPADITAIGDSAFSRCESLTTINIPAGVTTIGNSAFSDCESLTSIDIPGSVTVIGERAFSGCENLSSIIVEEKNPRFTTIDGVLFDKIENRLLWYPAEKQDACYTIPAGVTSIGHNAFSGCESLVAIDIPASVTSIGDSAFAGCKSLVIIDLPGSVTVIGERTFSGCENLAVIDISIGVITIGDYAFADCESLTAIAIPATVTAIGDSAFSGCKSITAITLPAGITGIGDSAFSGCKNLSGIRVEKQNQRFTDADGVLFDKIKNRILCYPAGKKGASYAIPAGVITIGDCAFSGCESITAIDIPGSVTAIGEHAFFGCKSLTAITLPAGITGIGDSTFFGCENLSSIRVEKQNQRFTDADGVLFDKIENRILCYPAGKKGASYAIPAGVTSIEGFTFFYCESLTSIDIPGSVTAIGELAFLGCENLSSIRVEKQNQRFTDVDGVLIDKIENQILYYPEGKKEDCYTIPAGVITIGDSAFSGCENLVTINIPDNFASIGNFAFSDCENLKVVHLSRKTTVSEYAFDGTKTKIVYTD